MDSKTETQFVNAIMQGNFDTVVELLDAGADLEHPDVHGFAGLPLRMSSFLGHKDIVIELLRRGAQINAANRDGPGAPLRMATRGKRDEIVAILLKHGAQPLVAPVAAPAAAVPPVPVAVPPAPVTTPPVSSRAGAAADFVLEPAQLAIDEPVAPVLPKEVDIEQLVITGCYGVDTNVLDAELLRASQSDLDPSKSDGNEPTPGKRKFWRR